MASSVYCLSIDCADPAKLGEFWAAVLGYEVEEDDDPDEVWLQPPAGRGSPLLFLRDPNRKEVKNRLHLDLNPDDQAAEVARLEGLGARRVDIGQGDQTWVVMADPEGNEFCVLTAREDA